jgi:hypothetical protein
MPVPQPIENLVHVIGIGDRAIEVGRQPIDVLRDRDFTDLDEAVEVPCGIVTTQLDLEAL